MIEISTRRLVLKKLRERDLAQLVSEIGNWEVVKWLSSVPYPYTVNDAHNWLAIASIGELNLNIFKRDLLIGGVGLTHLKDEYYELGYWLGESYWGNGYATEAAKSLLHFVEDKFHYKNFVASCMKGNDESAKVLRKIGFNVVGEDEIYCLSRKETVPSIQFELERK